MCLCGEQVQCHLRREDSQGVEDSKTPQGSEQSQRLEGMHVC